MSAANAQNVGAIDADMGYSFQTYSQFRSDRASAAFVSGEITWNMSPSIALEGLVSYSPSFQHALYLDSGTQTTTLAGAKIGWRGSKMGVYGDLRPGLASFSCGYHVIGPGGNLYSDCSRRTHFAMQYGGTVEYSVNPHTFIRADFSQMMITEFDQVIARTTVATESLQGHIAQHFDLRLSVGHSFGVSRKPGPSMDTVDRIGGLDGGILYGLQIKEHAGGTTVSGDSGIGVWLSWDHWRYLSLDTAAIDFPRDDHTAEFQDGGTALLAVAGVKAGVRSKRIGMFAKVRPGTILFSRALDSESITATGISLNTSKFADLAFDTGGVIEIYPSSHLLLRAEAGDNLMIYRAKSLSLNGTSSTIQAQDYPSVLFLFGFGYRFGGHSWGR